MRSLLGFIFLSLIVVSPTYALFPNKPVDEIFHDFRPLEARLIVHQGRYYLNIGSQQGLKLGEWWQIYKSGSPIVDPVTGKVLGREDFPVAVAQIVRLTNNYAELRVFCLNTGCTLSSGFVARRFVGIPAYFFDLTGRNFRVYEILRSGFPDLSWQPYRRTTSRREIPSVPQGLIFIVENGYLSLLSNGYVLGVYALTSPRPSRKIFPSSTPSGYKLIGELKEIVYYLEVQKFDSGTSFLAYLTKNGIHFQRLRGQEHYVYRYQGFGEIVNFSVGPQGLVAINIFDGQRMLSRIVRFERGQFSEITKDVDYILQFFDFDLDGVKETLLGQPFDREEFFGRGLHLLVLSGDTLRKVRKIEVPFGFRIFGSFFADLNGDRFPEIGFFNIGQRLVIFQGKKKFWSSTVKFGGSIQFIQMDNPEPEFPTPKTIVIWPPSEVTRWQNYPMVLMPYNKFGSMGVTFSGVEYSTVALLYHSRHGYSLAFWKENFRGAVQSVFVDRDTLYLVVVEGNFFKGKGTSKIFRVPLDQIVGNLDIKVR